MIKTHLKQGINLIKQNPLFSGFYILGTGLAISMVMVLAVIYYIKVAEIYPETNRWRMMVAKEVHMQNIDDPSWNTTYNIGYNLLKDCFYGLENVEAVSGFSSDLVGEGSVKLPSGKHRVSVIQKAVDTAFWEVFEFSFIHGKPFSETDFTSGIRTVVISEETARRVFQRSDVVGQYMTIDFKDYKICGVVEAPSYATELSYAQVWMPYTCVPGYDQANQMGALGVYQVAILAKSSDDFENITAQVDDFTRKFNTIPHEGYKLLLHGQPYAYWKSLFYIDSMTDLDFTKIFRKIGLILLMLLLVPALNLSGMISSRMDKRLPEMGVRKAFGAAPWTLFSQIISENLILTVLGGLLGLLISFGMVVVSKNWLLTLLDDKVTGLPDGVQMSISAEMLFNPALFILTFLVCMVLNLFSALFPAYLALRKNIVYSLNKQK